MARPAFEPTAAMRLAVHQLKRAGWADERIAVRLSIARGTLLKHFSEELEAAADDIRAFALEQMWRAAKRGRASAIIWLARRFDAARKAED